MPMHMKLVRIGLWFANKYVEQAMIGTVRNSARNLRKQGVPLHIALLILTGSTREL